MITKRTALFRAQLKLAKPIVSTADIQTMRVWQDRLGELGAAVLKGVRVSYTPEPFDNFEAEWAVKQGSKQNAAILYLHGGSYCCGTILYAKGFGGILAAATRIPTLCVGYRLAPEHPFPAALDDALEAYKRILQRVEPNRIAIAGESAGGGLTFALMLKLKELGLPLPSCAATLSPWVDLTCSLPAHERNKDKDPTLDTDALKKCGIGYGGENLRSAFVSPLFGDLTGLPPCMIIAGTDELLEDDSIEMTLKLRAAGVLCDSFVDEGLWHVYPLFNLPESKTAIRRMTTFIKKHQGNER